MIVITGRSEDVEKARDRILKIQSELVWFYYCVSSNVRIFQHLCAYELN
jgi:hypothetical protein